MWYNGFPERSNQDDFKENLERTAKFPSEKWNRGTSRGWGAALPVEVKSGPDYKSHAALDNMMSVSDYGLSRAVVYTAHNEIEDGPIAYFPIYALMLLEHDLLPDGAVYKLEL